MKSALFGAFLLIGTAALAQPATTEVQTTATTGATVAPGNTNPETDARGIPVISAPAVAPPGWNAAPGQGAAPASGPAPSMGAAADLPPCSRTVTDRCVQTYERGVRRPR